MTFARIPITAYMTSDLERARLDTPLPEVARALASRRISAVPVVDAGGAIVGVVSRSDLVYRQRRQPLRDDETCAALVSRAPVVAESSASLIDAARLMTEHRIHRVFVVDGARLVGVVSATDVTRAVAEARLPAPIDTIMSQPVVTIDVDGAVAVALERLDVAHVTGLIVTEHDWPIGVFTQEDALAARDLPPATAIGALFDPALICLPRATLIHRAAAMCVRMDVRRIVVSHQRDFVGVVSGVDFARAVARS